VEELPPPPPDEELKKRNMGINFKPAKEIITESGGVQEVVAPPLKPTAEE